MGKGKGFPCDFWDGLVCPHKKCACVGRMMHECFNCPHYKRFVRYMEEQEEEFFEEVERMEAERMRKGIST